MPLTENSGQVFLPGGCNRTQNLRFGPYTNIPILTNELDFLKNTVISVERKQCRENRFDVTLLHRKVA